MGDKKIPVEILNSSLESQKQFLEGYYFERFTKENMYKSKTELMGLFQLLQNCKYSPILRDEDNNNDCGDNTVKEIIDVSAEYANTFVYDFATDNHHFHASVGNMIVHNCDGLHISSLIMNFFHALFPSILQRAEPFLFSMLTPIVRVFNPKGDILFYDENKFKEFVEKQTKPIKSKYYKGLGTTRAEDVEDTFGSKMVNFRSDDKLNAMMNKVFHKKFTDDRKNWLEEYNPVSSFSFDEQGRTIDMNISSYLDTELIKFSIDDCKRSIPCIFDGLKQSQRKILYCVKKKNLTYNKPSLKVAQFGGYVAEHSGYHHGEQNLYETTVRMAQDFVGSNNIPLLYRDGMFGSRSYMGKDSASARYIFTKMDKLTHLIFRNEDDPLLEYLEEDGDKIEPKFYIPIIPMILINGTTGIGTGWSSNILCYNPIDIIESVRVWIANDGEVILEDPDDNSVICLLPELKPWYRNFKGTIEENGSSFVTKGIMTKIGGGNKIHITELPIGLSTNGFKEQLEDLVVNKMIKNMSNNSTPIHIDFTITCNDNFTCDINNLKLTSSLSVSNMVLFNERDQLKKYTVDNIVNDFCIMRYKFYVERKKYQLRELEKEIINEKLVIKNKDKKVVVKEMIKLGYDKEDKEYKEVGEDVEDKENNSCYDYLLKMEMQNMTANKIANLENEIKLCQDKIDYVSSRKESQMWLDELQELEKAYIIYEKENIDAPPKKKEAVKKKK